MMMTAGVERLDLAATARTSHPDDRLGRGGSCNAAVGYMARGLKLCILCRVSRVGLDRPCSDKVSCAILPYDNNA